MMALTGNESNRAPQVEVVVSPAFTGVDTLAAYRVSFVVTQDSIAPGGGIKIRFMRGFGRFEKPQNLNPDSGGYVDVRATRPGAKMQITQIKKIDWQVPWSVHNHGWVITAVLQERALYEGDSIHVHYGSENSAGQFRAPRSPFIDTIFVALAPAGNKKFREITPMPTFEVRRGAPFRLVGYLPSNASTNVPVPLRLVVLDKNDNLATSFSGTISLTPSDARTQLPAFANFSASDSGRKNVSLAFRTEGIHYVEMRALGRTPDSLWQVYSNPVQVQDHLPPYNIYWGDLHSHSRYSFDGYGADPFAVARDVACLDFYALADHASNALKKGDGLVEAEWNATKQQVVRYHAPGKFVTIPAYEFSAAPPSGHHNVYFNAPDELVPLLPILRDEDYLQIQEVWKLKETVLPAGVEMLTVPHHTGIVWNKNFDPEAKGSAVSFGAGYADEHMRPLIEIYSHHGLSESYEPDHPLSYPRLDDRNLRACSPGPHYAQNAWAAGEKLGVIASSDDHTSRPGLEVFGLTAVYATALTREAVFQALKQRRTYATTGRRMLLHFDINGELMGSQIQLEAGAFPEINWWLAGTDDWDFAEVLKWNMNSGDYKNGHPQFETIFRKTGAGRHLAGRFADSTFADATIYYLRAKQKRNALAPDTSAIAREIWAWSSPIWVYPAQRTNAKEGVAIPRRLQLAANHPNPFTRDTMIRYYLPSSGHVKATLFNALGQQVGILLDEVQSEGWGRLPFSGVGLAPGIYFVRIEAFHQIAAQKIVLID